MLLSIDPAKIAEQLKKHKADYVVSCSHVEGSELPLLIVAPSIEVTSTVVGLPAEQERSRARLLTLRQRLLDSGEKPLTADDFDRDSLRK